MPSKTLIAGEQIRLIPLEDCNPDEYADRYFENRADLLASGNSDEVKRKSQIYSVFNRTLCSIDEGDVTSYGIHERQALIGEIAVTWFPDEPEVEYWVTSDCRGKGIATAAVETVTRGIFVADNPSVVFRILPSNIPSQRVVTKLGAVRVEQCSKDMSFDAWRLYRGQR